MAGVRYIGAFPPPYGGVTIKNDLIFLELSQKMSIKRCINTNKRIGEIKNIFLIMFEHKSFIIGISAVNGKSIFVSWLLFVFNRKAMYHSIYFMMGGLEANKIAENRKLVKIYSNYAKIYVETNAMKKRLEDVGMENVRVFPNCRKRPRDKIELLRNNDKPLECVFFSNIQILKGVDIILDVAENMPKVKFYFYGHIDEQYKTKFMKRYSSMKNVFYKGVFSRRGEDIYYELRKYDILLLPTQWDTEGIPGILVEGKVAGLAEIVSNRCYNAELVEDKVSGIVLRDDTPETLKKAIEELDHDRDRLYEYKLNSQRSAERFFVDNYINEIEESIKFR